MSRKVCDVASCGRTADTPILWPWSRRPHWYCSYHARPHREYVDPSADW